MCMCVCTCVSLVVLLLLSVGKVLGLLGMAQGKPEEEEEEAIPLLLPLLPPPALIRGLPMAAMWLCRCVRVSIFVWQSNEGARSITR